MRAATACVTRVCQGFHRTGRLASRSTSRRRTIITGQYAIALHGGAGAVAGRDYSATQDHLRELARECQAQLSEGASALDVVESAVKAMETSGLYVAGRGSAPNTAGYVELDASIMDGATLSCGAVAAVTGVKNPISLARLVMQRTPHVLLAGAGAERFADEMGVERVSQRYYYTQRRWEALQEALAREPAEPGGGTVGVVALDREGRLAAGTSTGGLTNKLAGRVGDTPIIGAGTYADADCATSGTGVGEEFIRHGVARRICLIYEDLGLSIADAAAKVVHQQLEPGHGGVIAVTRDGEIALVFNTPGMYRGAADSTGRFEVAIWE